MKYSSWKHWVGDVCVCVCVYGFCVIRSGPGLVFHAGVGAQAHCTEQCIGYDFQYRPSAGHSDQRKGLS